MQVNKYRAKLRSDSGIHFLTVTASSEEAAILLIQAVELCPRRAILHLKTVEMETKLVDYAYPTSTTATRAGYAKTGCWFVALYKGDKCAPKKIVDFFPDKEAANAYAELLPNPYHWMHYYLLERELARTKSGDNNQ